MLIRHCSIDTTTNIVVNIVDYETEQSGVPNGLEDTLLVVPSVDGEIGGTYANGVITKWTESAVAKPSISELATIKDNYQQTYQAAITSFSEYSDFYDAMIAKINAIPNCTELEKYTEKMVTDFFKDKLAWISAD